MQLSRGMQCSVLLVICHFESAELSCASCHSGSDRRERRVHRADFASKLGAQAYCHSHKPAEHPYSRTLRSLQNEARRGSELRTSTDVENTNATRTNSFDASIPLRPRVFPTDVPRLRPRSFLRTAIGTTSAERVAKRLEKIVLEFAICAPMSFFYALFNRNPT